MINKCLWTSNKHDSDDKQVFMDDVKTWKDTHQWWWFPQDIILCQCEHYIKSGGFMPPLCILFRLNWTKQWGVINDETSPWVDSNQQPCCQKISTREPLDYWMNEWMNDEWFIFWTVYKTFTCNMQNKVKNVQYN